MRGTLKWEFGEPPIGGKPGAVPATVSSKKSDEYCH